MPRSRSDGSREMEPIQQRGSKLKSSQLGRGHRTARKTKKSAASLLGQNEASATDHRDTAVHFEAAANHHRRAAESDQSCDTEEVFRHGKMAQSNRVTTDGHSQRSITPLTVLRQVNGRGHKYNGNHEEELLDDELNQSEQNADAEVLNHENQAACDDRNRKRRLSPRRSRERKKR